MEMPYQDNHKNETKNKEIKTEKLLPEETVLPDDYPIYYRYVYIGDMKIIRNEIFARGTVRDLKRELGLKEVRKCALWGHGDDAKIGDELTKEE